MAQTSTGGFRGRTTTDTEPITGWTGWIVFGGVMMILLGAFHAIAGLVAVFNSGYYLVTASGLVVSADFTVWGWLHFGIGVLAIAIGIGLLMGNFAAQIGGVVIAGLSAIVNLAFIPAYPLWSIIIIVLDVFVIYAIVVHGREMRQLVQ